MRFGHSALVGLLLPLFALSCSSNKADPPGNDGGEATDSAVVGCQMDPRAETYAPKLTKTGKAGIFQFVLVSAMPAPPALNDNSWTLQVLDASGQPVQGLSFVSITPFMPDHGHGTSAVPQAMPNADGTFTIAPLYLFMAGLWQVTIVAKSGSQEDSAVFSFCVAG